MDDLRERIEALPGMPALLSALDGLAPAWLVGGAVRDLLRGATHVDLDVAVEGDAREVARTVAERLGGEAVEHERFGTASVSAPELRVDMATARRETYPEPGALPVVDPDPAPLAVDLARRDFTVNAMAASLSGPEVGALVDPFGGRGDLAGGVVRVLHDRSFLDDPTRLLRALRYEARLGGRMEQHTEELARAAIAAGAPRRVSGKRIRDELLDLLAEPEGPSAVARMRELRLDAALHPALRAHAERVASARLGCAETGADPVLAALAALLVGDADALHPWLDSLALTREERNCVARAAACGPRLAEALRPAMPASRIHALLHAEPRESLALALAWGAPAEPVLRFVRDLRPVRLEVTGDDLVAAGVPESAALGRALDETLRRKLDGEVAGRADELALALSLARSGEGGSDGEREA
jgi:tRNA nucleotidyltransferase (CCA-adding enzyme)